MKKFILSVAAVLALTMFAACGGSNSSNATDTDSVEVVVDSLAVDTLAVDSVIE